MAKQKPQRVALPCPAPPPSTSRVRKEKPRPSEQEHREAVRREVLDGLRRLRRLQADQDTYQRLLGATSAALALEDDLQRASSAGVTFEAADMQMFTVLDELAHLFGIFGDDPWHTAGEPDAHGLMEHGPRVEANADAVRAHIERNRNLAGEWFGGVTMLGSLLDEDGADAKPG